MIRNDRQTDRGPLERLLIAGITWVIPTGVALFLILDLLAFPTRMILAILGGVLAAGGFYVHLLAQVRIADALSERTKEREASSHQV